MEFVKLLKAGSIISGINWAIYLIHEWVNFAKNNPPDALAQGSPIFGSDRTIDCQSWTNRFWRPL